MKLRPKQIERLVNLSFKALKEAGVVEFKQGEEKARQRAVEVVKKNYEQEEQLDREVQAMMDQLEKQHGGEFERYKMFPMLKKKLAKEKGIIL